MISFAKSFQNHFETALCTKWLKHTAIWKTSEVFKRSQTRRSFFMQHMQLKEMLQHSASLPRMRIFWFWLWDVTQEFPLKATLDPRNKQQTNVALAVIYHALVPLKASALPAFHIFSGSDCTGSLSGKGKTCYWKAFQNSGEETLPALKALGSQEKFWFHSTSTSSIHLPNLSNTDYNDLSCRTSLASD